MTLPDRISTARSSCQPRIGPPGHSRVTRGDIRQVESSPGFDAAVRLALVLAVDYDKGSVEIVLVHPYAELATEADLIFSPDETGTTYPVVAQTRVRSVVWTHQMRKRVGRLSEKALKEFSRVTVAADPFVVSSRTGPHLAGPADSRWRFKQQEVKTLNQLAAARISTIFKDDLSPRRLSLVSIPHNLDTLSTIDEFNNRSLKGSLENLGALQDCGDLDLDTWTEQFGSDLGRDLYTRNMQQIDISLALAA